MKNNAQSKISYLIPLINLLIAMLLGLLLRYIPIQNSLSINYQFFLHAHSHVAFLGWIYIALFVLLLKTFLTISPFEQKKYHIQFWIAQVSVIGMLIFFPIQGYALYSISFSTLNILVSWWFTYSLVKDLNTNTWIKDKHPVALKFVKASLFFLVISSLGPFAMGPIMAMGLASHPIYDLAIYFYLHFQYNGWFSMALIGIFVALYESRSLVKNSQSLNYFFWLMFWACVSGFVLSTLYLNPSIWIFIIGFISAAAQVVAVFYAKKAVGNFDVFNRKTHWLKSMIQLAFICFILKIVMQLFSVFTPHLLIRNFIIGYLHLTLLGFVSFVLYALFLYFGWFTENRTFKTSITLIAIGFIGSEIAIFGQGILPFFGLHFPYYFLVLFALSMLLPIGLVLLLLDKAKERFSSRTSDR